MRTNIVAEKVIINGTDLYYEHITGSTDKLTIVFESGYGWDLNNWNPIKDEVSKFANVFMYDRDGVGKSAKSNQPKHSIQIIENLRSLLQKLEIKPPYVLIGHSFGGLNVRLYASKYPEEIVGVILLDSVHEDQNKKMISFFNKKIQEEYLGQFTVEGSLSEFEESLEQVRGTSLGNMPLIVMTGGTQLHHTTESMTVWMEFQRELANLSSNSTHLIVREAGHAIHIDHPQLVIKAIIKMMGILKV